MNWEFTPIRGIIFSNELSHVDLRGKGRTLKVSTHEIEFKAQNDTEEVSIFEITYSACEKYIFLE